VLETSIVMLRIDSVDTSSWIKLSQLQDRMRFALVGFDFVT
jgi:hypothetical protein